MQRHRTVDKGVDIKGPMLRTIRITGLADKGVAVKFHNTEWNAVIVST